MKFKKITDTQIKIILSLRDMALNNVSAENIFSNSASSQKLLQNILNEAKKEIGFETGNSKLLVEAIMSSDEECTFTITKLLDEVPSYLQNSNAFIFKFDNFDDIIDLCTFLNNLPYLCLKDISKNFSLIYYNNTYYLRFTETKIESIVVDYIKFLFSEFGTDVSYSSNIDGFLNEYGKIIFAQNAIIKCIHSFCK